MGFITPRSEVQVLPPLPTISMSYHLCYRGLRSTPQLGLHIHFQPGGLPIQLARCNRQKQSAVLIGKALPMSATSLSETIAKQELEPPDPKSLRWPQRTEAVGQFSFRYGLVLVLFWIGGLKGESFYGDNQANGTLGSGVAEWRNCHARDRASGWIPVNTGDEE